MSDLSLTSVASSDSWGSMQSPTPESEKGGSEWDPLPVSEQVRHEHLFFSQEPIEGYLPGEKARDLFLKSGLPLQILSKIWNLADETHDNLLDISEFTVAMHLIQGHIMGKKLPKTLPDSLKLPKSPPVSLTEMSPRERAAYQTVFQTEDQDRNGYIDHSSAWSVFTTSNLPLGELALIWDLSDFNGDGKLDMEEFTLACRLVRFCKKGNKISGAIDVTSAITPPISASSLKAKKERLVQMEKKKQTLMLLKEKRKTQHTRENKRLQLEREKTRLLIEKHKLLRENDLVQESETEFQSQLEQGRKNVDRMTAVADRLKKEHEIVRQNTVKMILEEQKLSAEVSKEEKKINEVKEQIKQSQRTKDLDPFHQLFEERKEAKLEGRTVKTNTENVVLPFSYNPFHKDTLHPTIIGEDIFTPRKQVEAEEAWGATGRSPLTNDYKGFDDNFIDVWAPKTLPKTTVEDVFGVEEEDTIFRTVPVCAEDDDLWCSIPEEAKNELDELKQQMDKLNSERKELNKEGEQLVFKNPEDYLAKKTEEEDIHSDQPSRRRLGARNKSAEGVGQPRRQSYAGHTPQRIPGDISEVRERFAKYKRKSTDFSELSNLSALRKEEPVETKTEVRRGESDRLHSSDTSEKITRPSLKTKSEPDQLVKTENNHNSEELCTKDIDKTIHSPREFEESAEHKLVESTGLLDQTPTSETVDLNTSVSKTKEQKESTNSDAKGILEINQFEKESKQFNQDTVKIEGEESVGKQSQPVIHSVKPLGSSPTPVQNQDRVPVPPQRPKRKAKLERLANRPVGIATVVSSSLSPTSPSVSQDHKVSLTPFNQESENLTQTRDESQDSKTESSFQSLESKSSQDSFSQKTETTSPLLPPKTIQTDILPVQSPYQESSVSSLVDQDKAEIKTQLNLSPEGIISDKAGVLSEPSVKGDKISVLSISVESDTPSMKELTVEKNEHSNLPDDGQSMETRPVTAASYVSIVSPPKFTSGFSTTGSLWRSVGFQKDIKSPTSVEDTPISESEQVPEQLANGYNKETTAKIDFEADSLTQEEDMEESKAKRQELNSLRAQFFACMDSDPKPVCKEETDSSLDEQSKPAEQDISELEPTIKPINHERPTMPSFEDHGFEAVTPEPEKEKYSPTMLKEMVIQALRLDNQNNQLEVPTEHSRTSSEVTIEEETIEPLKMVKGDVGAQFDNVINKVENHCREPVVTQRLDSGSDVFESESELTPEQFDQVSSSGDSSSTVIHVDAKEEEQKQGVVSAENTSDSISEKKHTYTVEDKKEYFAENRCNTIPDLPKGEYIITEYTDDSQVGEKSQDEDSEYRPENRCYSTSDDAVSQEPIITHETPTTSVEKKREYFPENQCYSLAEMPANEYVITDISSDSVEIGQDSNKESQKEHIKPPDTPPTSVETPREYFAENRCYSLAEMPANEYIITDVSNDSIETGHDSKIESQKEHIEKGSSEDNVENKKEYFAENRCYSLAELPANEYIITDIDNKDGSKPDVEDIVAAVQKQPTEQKNAREYFPENKCYSISELPENVPDVTLEKDSSVFVQDLEEVNNSNVPSTLSVSASKESDMNVTSSSKPPPPDLVSGTSSTFSSKTDIEKALEMVKHAEPEAIFVKEEVVTPNESELELERKQVISQMKVRRKKANTWKGVTGQPSIDESTEDVPVQSMKKYDERKKVQLASQPDVVPKATKQPPVKAPKPSIDKVVKATGDVEPQSPAEHLYRKEWEEKLGTTLQKPNLHRKTEELDLDNMYEADVESLDNKLNDSIEVEDYGTVDSRKHQWDKKISELEQQPNLKKEIKLSKEKDLNDPYANESAIDREIRLALEREEKLKQEHEMIHSNVPKTQTSELQKAEEPEKPLCLQDDKPVKILNSHGYEERPAQEVTENDIVLPDSAIEREILLQQMREQEFAKQRSQKRPQTLFNKESIQSEHERQEKETERVLAHESIVEREIRLQIEREQAIARERETAAREVIASPVSVTPSNITSPTVQKQPTPIRQTPQSTPTTAHPRVVASPVVSPTKPGSVAASPAVVSIQIQVKNLPELTDTPDEENGTEVMSFTEAKKFNHPGESRIARELREQREREEEIERMRKLALLKQPDENENETIIEPELPHDDNKQNGTYHKDVKPYKSDRKPLDSVESVPSTSSSAATPGDFTPRTPTMNPFQDIEPDDNSYHYTPLNETPIEREIRLAREREAEFRSAKGLDKLQSNEKSSVKVSGTTPVKSGHKVHIATSPVEDGTVKRYATSRLQHEIELERQRELDLQREGHIKSTSDDHVGVDGTLEAVRTYRDAGINMIIVDKPPVVEEKPVENGEKFSIKKSARLTETKIQQEMREMKEREEELRKQRNHSNPAVQSPSQPEPSSIPTSENTSTMHSEVKMRTKKSSDSGKSNTLKRRSRLAEEWEQKFGQPQ